MRFSNLCGSSKLASGLLFLAFSSILLAQPATITTAAGNGAAIFSIPDGIAATSAQIPYPADLDVDSQGRLYFVYSPDTFGVGGSPDVYVITPPGIVTKAFQLPIGFYSSASGVGVAPDGSAIYATNYVLSSYVFKKTSSSLTKIGTNYSFSFPLGPGAGIRSRNGLVYVADTLQNRIVRIGPDGTATVVAGTGTGGYGGDGGPAVQAKINSPAAIAVDSAGTIYIADTNNNCVRKVSTSGTMTTIAGTCLIAGFSGDSGLATAAKLSRPQGIAVGDSGAVYVADSDNNRVRRINTDGTIETIAGGGQCNGPYNCVLGDGGQATIATLNNPHGMAFDAQGRLYVADTGNNRIRLLTFGATPSATAPKISATGIVNAASFVPTVSRGSWAAIFGSNLSAKPGRVWASADFSGNKLPTTLDGTSVTFNGIPAAIYYVSPTQLDVQVPDGLPSGGVTVAVTTVAGTGSATVLHQSTSPALFSVGQATASDGTVYSYPAAVHLDGTVVGRSTVVPGSRPATAGEIIEIFGTGYGTSNPVQLSGYLFSPAPLDTLITVSMANSRILPLASFLISPGLYQFNVQMPGAVQSGYDYGIQIGILGGAQSQANLYIPIN